MSNKRRRTEDSATAWSISLQAAKNLITALTPEELTELKYCILEQLNIQSPLLVLAPELRNRIYYFAALDALPTHVRSQKVPALLSASRQIRREFSGLYFSDAIMTLERLTKVDGIARWDRIVDKATISALLLSQHVGQSVEFLQLFGCSCSIVHRSDQGLQSDLSIVSVALARTAAEECDQYAVDRNITLQFCGTLVFNAASGERSQMVYKFHDCHPERSVEHESYQ